MTNEYINIPVLVNFDPGQQVGVLRLLKSALPPNPDFVFYLGFITSETDAGSYELLSVSMVSDKDYIKFLETYT